MMPELQVKELRKVVKYNDQEYDFPNQDYDIKQTLNHMADVLDPKLVNANAEGPTIVDDKLVWEVSATVGRKG